MWVGYCLDFLLAETVREEMLPVILFGERVYGKGALKTFLWIDGFGGRIPEKLFSREIFFLEKEPKKISWKYIV